MRAPEESPVRIVKKVWGEEQWIVNRDYCGKRLLLRGGFRSSIHSHRVKEETFYVFAGRMMLEVGEDPENLERRLLGPGDVVDLLPGTWHRFSSLIDTEFFEFSTHHEDDDSYRVTSSESIPEEELRALREEWGVEVLEEESGT
jgi:mannose-6-phosphate isomerase-like protein (cupin superfamily)